MNNSNRKAKIFQEDTVQSASGDLVGVVTSTWHDQQQPTEGCELLSPGQFVVNWLDDFGPFGVAKLDGQDITILHEDSDDYRLIDRSFSLGDAVKLDSSAPMSGIVQHGETYLQIRHLATREVNSCSGQQVSMEAERYQVGDYVVANDWVGIVKDVTRRSLVRFHTGQLAFCNELDLNPVEYNDHNIFYPEMLPCTTIVEISKHAAKHAQYIAGQFEKGMSRSGVVCFSRLSRLFVDWQFQNMMTAKFTPIPRPPQRVDLEDQGSDNSLLDIRTSRLFDGIFTYQVGDTVRLKSVPNPNFVFPYTEFQSPDRNELKQHCYDWLVTSTRQQVNVLWQNGTHSDHLATDLVPYLNVDELDTWPADHVLSKATGKAGIVQTCDAEERIAVVRWSGPEEIEEVSLYDLMIDESFNVDLGDLVLIMPEDGKVDKPFEPSAWGPSSIVSSISSTISRYLGAGTIQTSEAQAKSYSAVDWFGQLVAVKTDGMCKVALAYDKPSRDVEVPITRLVHVAGGEDEDGDTTTDDGSDLEIDSTDSESESDELSDENDHPDVHWYTGDAEGAESLEQSDWLDEDTEEIEDEEMIDVVAESVTLPSTTDLVLEVSAAPAESKYDYEECVAVASSQSASVLPDLYGNTRDVTVDRSTEVLQASQPISVRQDTFPLGQEKFMPFSVLDIEPTDHTYVNEILNRRPSAMKRMSQEYRTLGNALPPGILVRTYESRMDLLRVVIFGPLGTPYEYSSLLFDFYLTPDFPEAPPMAHFHSWTNGVGRCNPNLYEDGKVCLSLLGTWHGNSESETWTSKSSLLQVLVSLQALVLVKDPYYNEAGYDILSAKDTAIASANYSERAYVLTRGFVVYALQNPIPGLSEEIQWFYLGSPRYIDVIIDRAEAISRHSSTNENLVVPADSSIEKVSKGALVLLQRNLAALKRIQQFRASTGTA